jgi:hypothetical protein
MQRYRVSCYDNNDECLTELTVEAPDKAVAEMMVLTQLHGAGTPLADRVEKLVVRPDDETAETELAFDEAPTLTPNEVIGPERPSGERPVWGDDIKVYDPEKLAGLPSSRSAQIRRAAIVAGTLSATLAFGWVGWNSLHSAKEALSATSVDPNPASPAPSIGSDHSISTQSASVAEASRQPLQTVPMQGKIGTPVSGSSNAIQSALQPKITPVLQQKNPSASGAVHNRSKTQPTAFPETKPTTLDGWLIRDVANGRAVLQGPNGIWKVAQGDTIPGLGTVDSIVLWGNRWIVSTSRGLITTQ